MGPLLTYFDVDLFPKDMCQFFASVTNQAMDARKDLGEVSIVFPLIVAPLLIVPTRSFKSMFQRFLLCNTHVLHSFWIGIETNIGE